MVLNRFTPDNYTYMDQICIVKLFSFSGLISIIFRKREKNPSSRGSNESFIGIVCNRKLDAIDGKSLEIAYCPEIQFKKND